MSNHYERRAQILKDLFQEYYLDKIDDWQDAQDRFFLDIEKMLEEHHEVSCKLIQIESKDLDTKSVKKVLTAVTSRL